MNRPTEQRLIRLAAAGDRAAAEALIKQHQGSLYAYILRLSGKPDIAEDVVQEAFVRALSNLDRFDTKFRFSTWIFTIGRRIYLNFLDRLRPSLDGNNSVDEAMGHTTRHGRPESRASQVEERVMAKDAVGGALMLLSTDQRETIILHYQHDWPIWLIAQQMGIPLGTVKSHLHRGRMRLKEILIAQAQSRMEKTPAAVFASSILEGVDH